MLDVRPNRKCIKLRSVSVVQFISGVYVLGNLFNGKVFTLDVEKT